MLSLVGIDCVFAVRGSKMKKIFKISVALVLALCIVSVSVISVFAFEDELAPSLDWDIAMDTEPPIAIEEWDVMVEEAETCVEHAHGEVETRVSGGNAMTMLPILLVVLLVVLVAGGVTIGIILYIKSSNKRQFKV